MTREPFLRTRAGRVSLLAMLAVDVFPRNPVPDRLIAVSRGEAG